jgi:hypothetical protein
MESYRIMLFLHIAAVVVMLGPGYVFPFLQAFSERQGVRATRLYLRFAQRISLLLIYPGYVLVAVFGVGLIFDDRTGYKDDFPRWLEFAIPWYVIAVLLDVILMRRLIADGLRALEGATDDNALPVAYVGPGRNMQMVGGLIGLSVLGVLALMVWGAEGGF